MCIACAARRTSQRQSHAHHRQSLLTQQAHGLTGQQQKCRGATDAAVPECAFLQLQVYCVHTEPNYSLPWQRKRQFATTSTGFMINAGGAGVRWLLSNAHSVEYHSQVRTFLQHGRGSRLLHTADTVASSLRLAKASRLPRQT